MLKLKKSVVASGFSLALIVTTLTSTACFASYNRSAAVQYANQHALSPNTPWYPVFGEDCTNFVSQAVYNGGFPMVYGTSPSWWEHSSYNTHTGIWSYSWSHGWAVAGDYRQFLINYYPGGYDQGAVSPGAAQWATTPPSYMNFQPGDVTFYNWVPSKGLGYTHSAISVGWAYDPWYGWADTVDEHTNNRKQVLWSLADYSNYDATQLVDVMHISSSN